MASDRNLEDGSFRRVPSFLLGPKGSVGLRKGAPGWVPTALCIRLTSPSCLSSFLLLRRCGDGGLPSWGWSGQATLAHITQCTSYSFDQFSVSVYLFLLQEPMPFPARLPAPWSRDHCVIRSAVPGAPCRSPQSFVHLCWVMKSAPRVPQSAQYPYEHAESASKYLGIHFMPEDSSATRKKG